MPPSDLGVFVLATRGAEDEAGGSSAVKVNTMTTVEAVCTGVRNVRALTRVSLHPIPNWDVLEDCTAVALMTEHDDSKEASG